IHRNQMSPKMSQTPDKPQPKTTQAPQEEEEHSQQDQDSTDSTDPQPMLPPLSEDPDYYGEPVKDWSRVPRGRSPITHSRVSGSINTARTTTTNGTPLENWIGRARIVGKPEIWGQGSGIPYQPQRRRSNRNGRASSQSSCNLNEPGPSSSAPNEQPVEPGSPRSGSTTPIDEPPSKSTAKKGKEKEKKE
ncbi:MAG: hypothetical protein M1812_004380, partial [Candelaria pacifica]